MTIALTWQLRPPSWSLASRPNEPATREAIGPEQYVVLPFIYDSDVAARFNEVARLRAGLLRWSNIAVVSPLEVREVQARVGVATDRRSARRIARALSVDRYVLGAASRLPDGTQLEAALVDVRTNRTIRSASSRVPHNTARLDSIFAALADSLLLGGENLGSAPSYQGTRSISAVRAFARAQQALRNWDLAAADSLFAQATVADPPFAQAHLWLAQVRMWDDAPVARWTIAASEASRLRARLSSRDQLVSDAVMALARDDAGAACNLWARLTHEDENDFAAWYGLGHCLRMDSTVIRDSTSPSGWRFRSSLHRSFLAYRRAFELLPSIHRGFSRGGYQRTRRLLLISTGTDVVIGRALPPDTGRFLAYPGLRADTLALVPFPAQDIREAKPGTIPETLVEAVKHQRRLFYSMASTWVGAFPQSSHALEAMALSLELLGDRSALGVLQRARALAVDRNERVRMAVSETWLRLKFALSADPTSVPDVQRFADSVLRANPPSDAVEPLYLASLAALMGRAHDAAAYCQRHAAAAVETVAPSLARDAFALLAFASVGGPIDSLAALESRVRQAIDQTIPNSARERAEATWLLRPAALAFPVFKFPSLPDLAGTRWAVMEAELAFTRHDTAHVRRTLSAVAIRRRSLPPEDRTLDALFPEAWLLSTIGDDRAAAERLDATLAALPAASPEVLTDPARAGALVRTLALRAEIAERAGQRPLAVRLATTVEALWRDADPFLEPTLQRMAQVRTGNQRARN
ncbi:MAG TPA: hypothetical protein VFZ21_25650 [Gemmatimonadaceae bacterium]|nr:hypothetical protein [Gemmatimonadaceae bacterium]